MDRVDLAGTGVACNEWVLTTILCPEAMMEIQNSVAVWLFNIGCIVLGLSFGCAVTFGLWVNDDEILPCYVAQYASHYQPYNDGVPDDGPTPHSSTTSEG